MAHITRLSDITGISTPGAAPSTLRFSAHLTSQFEHLRRASFPGGNSKERGGTLVADESGNLHLQNIGGLGSTSTHFTPDLKIKRPADYSLVGTFHTHPYDKAEGSYNGVSFSGGDFSWQSQNGVLLTVVQSGPRLFALLQTAITHNNIPWRRHAQQTREIHARVAAGATFQQASRVEGQETAAHYGFAYYQGGYGVMTRV